MAKGVILTVNTVLDGDELSNDAAVLFGYLTTNRIPFGIISFRNNEQERKRFARSGLDSAATFRIFEQSKSLAFEQAFDRLALPPREVLVVTQKDEHILSVNLLNCISVKLDRKTQQYVPTPAAGDTPLYVIGNLEELIPLIP